MTSLQATSSTVTTINISWSVTGFVDHFQVSHTHTVKRCSEVGSPGMETISDSSARAHTLSNLEEDSSYTITVRAINTAGSAMAVVTASTLPTG